LTAGNVTCYITGLNPSNAGLNPICHLLALLGARHILHVSRVRVKNYKIRRVRHKFLGLRICMIEDFFLDRTVTPLTMEAIPFFQISGTDYPNKCCHIVD
jgi:hypothetical protein